jgi:hypothetical protein
VIKRKLRNIENAQLKSSFTYEKLNLEPGSYYICLLTLFPAQDFKADIHCELSLASLNDKPQYKALSYAWGSPNNTLPIYLHAEKHNVMVNLEAALR